MKQFTQGRIGSVILGFPKTSNEIKNEREMQEYIESEMSEKNDICLNELCYSCKIMSEPQLFGGKKLKLLRKYDEKLMNAPGNILTTNTHKIEKETNSRTSHSSRKDRHHHSSHRDKDRGDKGDKERGEKNEKEKENDNNNNSNNKNKSQLQQQQQELSQQYGGSLEKYGIYFYARLSDILPLKPTKYEKDTSNKVTWNLHGCKYVCQVMDVNGSNSSSSSNSNCRGNTNANTNANGTHSYSAPTSPEKSKKNVYFVKVNYDLTNEENNNGKTTKSGVGGASGGTGAGTGGNGGNSGGGRDGSQGSDGPSSVSKTNSNTNSVRQRKLQMDWIHISNFYLFYQQKQKKVRYYLCCAAVSCVCVCVCVCVFFFFFRRCVCALFWVSFVDFLVGFLLVCNFWSAD